MNGVRARGPQTNRRRLHRSAAAKQTSSHNAAVNIDVRCPRLATTGTRLGWQRKHPSATRAYWSIDRPFTVSSAVPNEHAVHRRRWMRMRSWTRPHNCSCVLVGPLIKSILPCAGGDELHPGSHGVYQDNHGSATHDGRA